MGAKMSSQMEQVHELLKAGFTASQASSITGIYTSTISECPQCREILKGKPKGKRGPKKKGVSDKPFADHFGFIEKEKA